MVGEVNSGKMFAFLYLEKTLQTAVRRACCRQSVCVSVCVCALFSLLYGSYVAFSVLYC